MSIDYSFLDNKIDSYVSMIENPEELVYDFEPVNIQEFVENKLYLNLNKSAFSNGTLYAPWMDELIKIFGEKYTFELPYNEVVFIASSGCGKSFISGVVASYLLYRDLIVGNLRRIIGLADKTLVMLLAVSISATHAKKIVFGEVHNRLSTSQWFNRYFRKDPKIESEIRIQKFEERNKQWTDTR